MCVCVPEPETDLVLERPVTPINVRLLLPKTIFYFINCEVSFILLLFFLDFFFHFLPHV